ncbi:MAG TPA: peptide-methionine (S)-S-oxide reductase MsrA [Pyrinomonadaceae bacterium]|nr:peptide-methionine (S)-S-oxide reductase MsrA [Pyrinomonadaceae bacterium]
MSRALLAILVTSLFTTMPACNAVNATAGRPLPNPIIDAPLAATRGGQTAVIAGGCFWGVQAVFEHVKGVISVSAGYSGGAADTAHYEMVSAGNTGHAESIRIKYDPSRISYGQLLKVYFGVAHDPTELNRQGPDTGTQYRSAIFYSNAEQKSIADAYIAQLNKAGVFKRAIVTQVVALKAFYEAEAYHQDYAVNHPDEPYIAINDLPKVAELRKQLPELYVEK